MSPTELSTPPTVQATGLAPTPDARWLATARRARWLSYFSLVWMVAEGLLGLLAGAQAHSIGVLSWALGSVVEGAAAVIVIVRLTGANRFSETAERRAQRWVAASFFVLIPYVLYEAVVKLVNGSQPDRNWLALAVLASSIVLMPALGWAKLRLGRQLSSSATAGEATQNLLCALQGATGLAGLLLASAGASFLDPAAALIIIVLAAREGVELWRGDECDCHAMPGFEAAASCADEDCESAADGPRPGRRLRHPHGQRGLR